MVVSYWSGSCARGFFVTEGGMQSSVTAFNLLRQAGEDNKNLIWTLRLWNVPLCFSLMEELIKEKMKHGFALRCFLSVTCAFCWELDEENHRILPTYYRVLSLAMFETQWRCGGLYLWSWHAMLPPVEACCFRQILNTQSLNEWSCLDLFICLLCRSQKIFNLA